MSESSNNYILQLEYENHRMREELAMLEAKYCAEREANGVDLSGVRRRDRRPPQTTIYVKLPKGHPYTVNTSH
jgi:hypothetical protein